MQSDTTTGQIDIEALVRGMVEKREIQPFAVFEGFLARYAHVQERAEQREGQPSLNDKPVPSGDGWKPILSGWPLPLVTDTPVRSGGGWGSWLPPEPARRTNSEVFADYVTELAYKVACQVGRGLERGKADERAERISARSAVPSRAGNPVVSNTINITGALQAKTFSQGRKSASTPRPKKKIPIGRNERNRLSKLRAAIEAGMRNADHNVKAAAKDMEVDRDTLTDFLKKKIFPHLDTCRKMKDYAVRWQTSRP